jgi:hypothetical protein
MNTILEFKTHLMLASLALAVNASAALITDYFEYGASDDSLSNLTTSDGSGWDGNDWTPGTGGGNVKYKAAESLTYDGSGYTDNTSGGYITVTPADGIVTRALSSPTSDTVFTSFMASADTWGFGGTRSSLLINGDSGDSFGVESSRLNFFMSLNGTMTVNGLTRNLAILKVLVVAKMETDYDSGVKDRLTIWAFNNKDLSFRTDRSDTGQ